MSNDPDPLNYATPPGDPRMKRVYRTADAMEAEFVRGLLENEGVPAVVQGANTNSWLGPLLGTAVSAGVLVREDDLVTAEAIVARYRAGEIDTGKPWACPRCGEQIEGQFTACWNCGATPDWDGPTPAIPLDRESLESRRDDLPDDTHDADADDAAEDQ